MSFFSLLMLLIFQFAYCHLVDCLFHITVFSRSFTNFHQTPLGLQLEQTNKVVNSIKIIVFLLWNHDWNIPNTFAIHRAQYLNIRLSRIFHLKKCALSWQKIIIYFKLSELLRFLLFYYNIPIIWYERGNLATKTAFKNFWIYIWKANAWQNSVEKLL